MYEHTPLQIEMLTRAAICLLARNAGQHDITYLETAGAGTKIAVNSPRGTIQRQKGAEVVISRKELQLSVDDFAEQLLAPAMQLLWKDLQRDKIAYTHTLVLPNAQPACREMFDGFCMRGVLMPKPPSSLAPNFGTKDEKDILLRFDVLYSRASDA